jgi:hypothetical protein
VIKFLGQFGCPVRIGWTILILVSSRAIQRVTSVMIIREQELREWAAILDEDGEGFSLVWSRRSESCAVRCRTPKRNVLYTLITSSSFPALSSS